MARNRRRAGAPLNPKTAPLTQVTDQVSLQPTLAQQTTPLENGALAAAPARAADIQPEPVEGVLTADITKEYISAEGHAWLATYIRSLPFYIDDTTRDFGTDIYDKMLLDPKIAQCMGVYKGGVLDQGIQLAAIEDADSTQPSLSAATETTSVRVSSKLATAVKDYCQRQIDNLQRPLVDTLYEMMDAAAVGNKLAEIVCEVASSGDDKGRLILKALKVKSRHSYSYVVDAYDNIVGILGLVPGLAAPISASTILGDPTTIPNLFPRSKFAVLTNRGKHGDPRGESDLRTCYSYWYLKRQALAEHMKWITQLAGPSIFATTPENAISYPDPRTGKEITPEQALLRALIGIKNGSMAVAQHGTTITPINMSGDGEAFIQAIALYNNEITKALLYQTLATEEGAHQARAAAETHQDILGIKIRFAKQMICAMVRQDILHTLVEANFGKDVADSLTPTVSLGETEHQDFAADVNAIANGFKSGVFHSSQLPGFDQMVGAPPRDMAAQAAEIKAEQAANDANQAAIVQATQKATASDLANQQAGSDAVAGESASGNKAAVKNSEE